MVFPPCAGCVGEKCLCFPAASLAWLSFLHARAQNCPWLQCITTGLCLFGAGLPHASWPRSHPVPASPQGSHALEHIDWSAPIWGHLQRTSICNEWFLFFESSYCNTIKTRELLQKCEMKGKKKEIRKKKTQNEGKANHSLKYVIQDQLPVDNCGGRHLKFCVFWTESRQIILQKKNQTRRPCLCLINICK